MTSIQRKTQGITVSLLVGLAVLLLAIMPMSAAAHGCVRSSGYWKNHLTVEDRIPYPAIGSTQVEKLDHAIEILSYGGPSMVEKLRRQVMATYLTLHNEIGDAQPVVTTALNSARAWLQSYDGHTLSRAEKAMVEEWKDVLDAYNTGDPSVGGPGSCD